MQITKRIKFSILLAVSVESEDNTDVIEQKALNELRRFIAAEDITDLIVDISDDHFSIIKFPLDH